ncbi:hypothetical protein ATANTOWER_021390 [Ataeniobius toweri]|uniref:HMG box domain-containing protein n=1 Tax=Ataeniobius toweri TaxID=208326 RepID=A0ABU7BAH2_9TELE|nr:hypothetical protein [Ataeniobius toweri]
MPVLLASEPGVLANPSRKGSLVMRTLFRPLLLFPKAVGLSLSGPRAPRGSLQLCPRLWFHPPPLSHVFPRRSSPCGAGRSFIPSQTLLLSDSFRVDSPGFTGEKQALKKAQNQPNRHSAVRELSGRPTESSEEQEGGVFFVSRCRMNGSSSVSAAQSPRIKAQADGWSKEDCLTLLERIRSLLPEGDAMKYKTTESHFDWDKVCFGSFTGEMCRQKWQRVSSEVRKYRTMTELIVDAIEFVKNPYKGKKLKTHPDFPKKPLTPYFRFFMEKRAKYAKIHPEMSNLDLTKILSKKYKELPDKKKQKYITEFQREKEEFEKNMARFREEHPELMEQRKKSDLPEKPKTPQQLWYNHEKKAYMKLHPEVSQKELKEALRRQWSQLPDKRRLKWISKALELQKDYEDSMKAYHEAHPDANSEDHVRSVLTKAERQLKDKFDGRPTKPPPNGYSLYCAELMVNMKDVPSTERMVLCSKQWKMLTQKEKDMFQKRCEQKKKQYDVDLQRFLESLPEEERERVLSEEKMGGAKLNVGVAPSPHRAKSPSVKVQPWSSSAVTSLVWCFCLSCYCTLVSQMGKPELGQAIKQSF